MRERLILIPSLEWASLFTTTRLSSVAPAGAQEGGPGGAMPTTALSTPLPLTVPCGYRLSSKKGDARKPGRAKVKFVAPRKRRYFRIELIAFVAACLTMSVPSGLPGP